MNNEIKEILDYLNDEKWEYYPSDMTPYKVLVMEERDKLLDYITNLQQELEEEKRIEEADLKTIQRLEEENEDNLKCIKSLKEQLESVINENQRLLKQWFEDNNKTVKLISEKECYKQNFNDYKSRCEKAIKYIDTNFCIENRRDLKEVVNILQNGSEEK